MLKRFLFQKSPLTPLFQRGELKLSHFEKGGLRGIFITLATVFLLIFIVPLSHAGSHGWLIYYEGGFKGKIIDSETKKPIEGAVVVAVYHINCLGFGHGGSVTVDVKETLTNKDGTFHLWPNISFSIIPWCLGGYTSFIIFKPGYASIKLDLSDYFSGKGDKNQEGEWYPKSELKFRLRADGTVELPKLKTREERLDAKRSSDIFGLEITAKDLPILYRIISEENKNLGLK